MVTVEILFKRTTKDGFVTVGGESTGEDRDVSESGFEGFVEDIGDFVFKILGCDEGIEEVSAVFAQHGVDFSTGSAEVLFVVECEPEFKDTVWARSCSCVQKDADLRFQDSAKSCEKPSSTVS
jgi:hypothetical protein